MAYPRKKYVPNPNDKPRAELEGSYTTVVVEGTGTKAQFTHLSDRLVRGSRIFWRLSEKIHEAKRLCGVYRALYTKAKADLKAITKAFKQYEKDADKLFKIQEKKIEKLTAQLEQSKKTSIRYWNKISGIRFLHRKRMDGISKMKKDYETMRRYRDFFTRKLLWKNGKSNEVKTEIFLRTIFEYKALEHKKEINHVQMMYLSVGHQIDAFNKDHVENRFGKESVVRFLSLINDLVDKGYIRRFERRNFYYVTEDGKAYFSKTLREIYSRKHQPYWEKVAKNIKYD